MSQFADDNKTPHDLTCDLLLAAKCVLGNHDSAHSAIALEMLSKAVCAFEQTFIVGGKL